MTVELSAANIDTQSFLLCGVWWGVGVLGLSLLVSAVTLTAGRGHGEHEEDADMAGHEEAAPKAA